MTFPDPLVPGATSVLDLFRHRVETRPDAPAVVAPQSSLTYRRLDERAERLAHRLAELPVERGDVVAVCTGRSVDAVVALLAVWKVGGVYLPLDPAYPAERLQYMLSDSSARCLVTRRDVLDHLPPTDVPIVATDEDAPDVPGDIERDIRPTDLAYIIYTSGSTGQPKGVCVEHGALATHASAIQDLWQLSGADRVVEFASLSFDVSLEEIVPTICSGATLILRGDDGWTPADLVERVEEFGVTVLDLPTAYWQQWVGWWQQSAVAQLPPTLRLVVIGGDAVLPEAVQRWRRTELSGIRLLNAYGPTETVITSLAYEVPRAGREDDRAVAIGTPLPGRTAHVMDASGRELGIDDEGELWIGGVALARGYLDRPALTQERFFPNPFQPEGRSYRTGDIVKRRADGNLEFLGRRDMQVKIRGFRVELGEIESAIAGHPAVAETVVEARDFGDGDRRLVAYVVPRKGATVSGSELRAHLLGRMPEYLVPAHILELDALPLMPNGKVDRASLPQPTLDRPEFDHPFVPPSTHTQHILADAWRDVLKIDRVGIHDNFFELGGDSLISMQMIARARQNGIRLRSGDLIGRPTIAELAAGATSGAVRVIAEQGTIEGPAPLVPSQVQYLEEDHPTAQWIERTVLELKRPLDPGLLEEALACVLAHHDVLRVRFSRVGGRWEQRILVAEEHEIFSVFDVRRVSEFHGRGGAEALEEKARGDIDITSGPLVRGLHIARVHKPSRLILYIHHLVVDAYSIPVLIQDLEAAYLQLEHGEPVHLSPKTTSFKAWGERLLDYAESGALLGQLEYWAGIGERARSLPSALSAREPSLGHLQYVTACLPSKETETLVRGIPRTQGIQLTDLLLAALVLGFRPWTGGEPLVLRLSAHGREAPFDDVDVSRTVGWFATEFPFLPDPGPDAGPHDVLAAVTEQLRQLPHGGLGYGVLRYMCRDAEIAAQLRALPPVHIGLNYQGRPDHLLEESSLFTIRKKINTQPPPDTVPVSYRLPVTAQIHGGQLYLRIRFHDGAYNESDIQGAMDHMVLALRALIHAARVAAGQ